MKNILILLSLCLSLFAADKNACGGEVKKELITTEISVFGSVLKPQKLNVAKLKELNATEVSQMAIVCGSGETKESSVSYKGAKLIDILDKAVVDISEKNGRNKIYVVATASDGYKALFSYQELENSVIGDKVIVFYEKNGSEVPDYEGKIGLISANDKKTGPRHIRSLKNIEIVRIK